ncbi:tripartite tricarboxylate transporter TctB family protein [Jonquetella anthropi]|uniref:tripartite tricarboxylate transporter TctB family protein n=1 Tax=Jonquetella anthropi TaxID=428712 RepID=UPI0001B91060|nr:tripartite tricarboxylate transporter TctB family protein [Jonquetella anthropi]EEX49116.1 hypothetical protein GCWU000246_00202 [Jonquetella anthropi E3_33 E1]
MNKKTLDILSGAAGILLAAAIFMAAASFPQSAARSARYVKFLSCVMGVLCAVLVGSAAFSRRNAEPIRWIKARRPFWLALVATVAYAAAMNWLGFYLSSGLYVIALGWGLGYRRPVSLFLSAAILLLVIWGVFERFLVVPIPRGIWGF